MKTITVLLCDDHTMFREGLRLLLEKEADIEIVGEAANGHLSVSETKRLKPDVVVQDISMPLLNGLGATRQITREVPAAKVIILSAFSDDSYIENAIAAGAAGYLMKQTIGSDLVRAIREVADGNAFFSPSVAKRLLRPFQSKDGSGKTKAALLTSRQLEILQLIAEGHANKQIAALLSLSIKTVEKHRQDLMNTLDIHNIATLTRYAVSSGVVESRRAPVSSTPVAPSAPA